MNRSLQLLAGPEVALAAVTGLVFLLCARHQSYSSADVRILERMVWLLPVIAVPAAFTTLFVTGAKSWWWLGRFNLALLVCLLACGLRIVSGFGAPGSGPKGQDAGLIVMLSLGLVLAAVATAFAGAVVLRAQHAGFADWHRLHPALAPTLTLASAVPIGIVLGLVGGALLAVAAGLHSIFAR